MGAYSDIVEDVYDALTEGASAVSVSVSADIRQRGDTVPAVVFTMEDAEFTRTAVESVAPVHVRMRFDCLHDTRLEADTLAADVKTALQASSLIVGHETDTTDLFSRGADVEPVYLTSSSYVITCGTL
jgi:hypothetical protein